MGETGFLHDGYSPRESASCIRQALRSCFIGSSATYKTEEADWLPVPNVFCTQWFCFLFRACV